DPGGEPLLRAQEAHRRAPHRRRQHVPPRGRGGGGRAARPHARHRGGEAAPARGRPPLPAPPRRRRARGAPPAPGQGARGREPLRGADGDGPRRLPRPDHRGALRGRRPVPPEYVMTGDTLARVQALLQAGEVRISAHGYDELAADGIFVRDVLDGMSAAEALEDYPDYPKGPSVLILVRDAGQRPIHVVWGIPKGAKGPAVLVTAYRPDPARWSEDFKRRKR